MRTFKSKAFARFAKQHGLDDDGLHEAVRRARDGQIDADLGGGVVKQRVARKGGGRSRGFRTVVLLRRNTHAFFVFGFAKSTRSGLGPDELKAFRLLADKYISLDEEGLAAVQANGTIVEVVSNGDAVQE